MLVHAGLSLNLHIVYFHYNCKAIIGPKWSALRFPDFYRYPQS